MHATQIRLGERRRERKLLPVDLEKCGGGRVMKYGCPPAAVIGRYFRTTEAQFL